MDRKDGTAVRLVPSCPSWLSSPLALMKPPKTVFVCQECGAQSPKWLGRCADCGAWNSLVEERPEATASAGSAVGHR